ncbi:MAG: outer membrane beta-barrel protein [Bacteroidia bacterium]|nr:outer membrane beta-barrel protein [Bacteroidia bacterium]MDW8236387.1 outer membrane beta-barrel protein [Bacteroidia bacterium]
MNYAQYPGEPELSYEKELYGEYQIYAQVWTSRSRARQGYLHPWAERRWEIPWGWLQVRVGSWFSHETQTFQGRQLGYMPDTAGGAPNVLDPEVYSLSFIRRVYDSEYISPGGWYLIERTGDLHRHRGRTITLAGYSWLRTALGRQWEALFGLRYEYWQRKLRHTPIVAAQEVPLKTFQDAHLLPALLIKYRWAEQHSLRLGGNFTLIRPPLPSQVPLRFFDFMYAYYWSGDLALSTAQNYNAELRYEWLSDRNNLLAVGIFYKYLRNLPEIYMTPASYTAVFNYSNRRRKWGEVMGIELEARKTLWENQRNRAWGYFTLALSESALEQPLWRKIDRLEGRLQGHSPIVGNLGIIYQYAQWEAALFANYTHRQIWAIGFDPYIFPHILENSRWTGEFQVSYKVGRWEVRAAILDFINMPYKRIQWVGNTKRRSSDGQAIPLQERWSYRGYLTLRYRVSQ